MYGLRTNEMILSVTKHNTKHDPSNDNYMDYRKRAVIGTDIKIRY